MTRNANYRYLFAVAAAVAGLALTFAEAHAASETTRRDNNAIQNYQNRPQTPYYSGQSNPYYGTPPQGAQGNPVPPPPPPPDLQNRIRQLDRSRTGQ